MKTRTVGRRVVENNITYQQSSNYNTVTAARGFLNLNTIPPFRNLPKEELASVIFGCKDATFEECMEKLIFGLPSRHFCYVRNVEPGMPIFLFNYSNRTLHGIFEACSYGALNISPSSWTKDDSEVTPFPAQVCVRIRQLCHPLPEDKFKRAISYNYYKKQNKDHFFFELDKYQTSMLLDLMVCEFPRSGQVKKASGTAVPVPQHWMAAAPLSTVKTANVMSTFLPGEAENYFSASDGGMSGENECSDTSSETEMHTENNKESMSTSSTEKESEIDIHVKLENLNVDDSKCVRESQYPEAQNQGLEYFIREDTAQNLEETDTTNMQDLCKDRTLKVDYLKQLVEIQKSRSAHGQSKVELPFARLDDYFKCIVELQKKNSDLEKRYDQVVLELQSLKHELTRMSIKLDNAGSVGTSGSGSSKTIIRDIVMEDRDHQKSNEPMMIGTCSPTAVNRWEALEQYSIYLLGGFDGNSCLQDVEVFYPATLRSVQFPKMQSPRYSAAGAVLHHRMYVFGGGNGHTRLETVETYDTESNRWLYCAPMNKRRTNLSSVVLRDRIFAIGGQHDKSTLSDVECLDPNLGEWLASSSMVSKRYSGAAVELDGAIYAIGGYNGQEHLSSVERFDVRQPFWTEISHMQSKRSALHAAALCGKIYAFGGYDGNKCLYSVECYEPRKNCWMEMTTRTHEARAFGAVVVVGDSLYIFGGVNMHNAGHEKVILETAECYNVSTGWDILELPSLGKRSSHVGLVLT